MRSKIRAGAVLAAGTAMVLGALGSAHAGQLSGAIFTTTVDGDIVNENVHYDAKTDVYLDGGPGPNAPASAAGLPEGDYYFQVTDPSGKDLLSSDHISCRKVHVNAAGVIDFVFPGTNYVWHAGQWVSEPCLHASGIDIDHSELGAITVQLYPFDDTPNPGGVYKAWMTPVGYYAGDPINAPAPGAKKIEYNVNGENWQPGNFHGFIPAWSKTDNYKVKEPGKPFDPPEINVLKFHDRNFNGVQDAGEEDVTGWAIVVTDPIGVVSDEYTPVLIVTDSGTYTIVEDTPDGTQQTVSTLDGAIVSLYPAANPVVHVNVEGLSGETHVVVYGNVGIGSITACKTFDRDGDGVADEGEPGIPGWRIELTGVDASGAAVGPIVQETGEDGCTTFGGLLPGLYTVTEILPPGDTWSPTGPISTDATIESSLNGADISGTAFNTAFTNVCTATADFDTKGYWHNKNGLAEITLVDIDYVNTLAPYSAPSSYFGAGDEPFDGYFADGVTPVAAAYNNEDLIPIANEGTAWAEVSHFLVDSNAGADPREQLAQQLLAFIFNTLHRLDDPDALIELPDLTWATASSLIAEAIAIWSSGTAAEQNAMQELLNALNNNDAVAYVPAAPCPFSYN
jgi:hypothetical protein